MKANQLEYEQLTRDIFDKVRMIDRNDIPESYVDTVDTIMDLTDYGFIHGCIGHTYAVKMNGRYISVILLGEALHWETDPPEMSKQPFYRLMGFVVDKGYRGRGLGGEILEQTISNVYHDFGIRPIALGCHKDNAAAARFYIRHGFKLTMYRESDDIYYIRYPDTIDA